MNKSFQVRHGWKLMLHTGQKMMITKREVNTLLGNTDLDGRMILKYVLNK
jgi:hypothetical protein